MRINHRKLHKTGSVLLKSLSSGMHKCSGLKVYLYSIWHNMSQSMAHGFFLFMNESRKQITRLSQAITQKNEKYQESNKLTL